MKKLFLITLAIIAVVAAFRWNEWRDWLDKGSVPQLTRRFSNSLVFVEGKAGAGSGFVCDIGGKKFAVTNQHVVAGNSGAKFTLLDRSPIEVGQAAAAVGHDIMTFALLSDTKAMEMMTEVEKNATVGDDVSVLGNSNGDRVIAPVAGKLLGIGPDRVEVSAEFVTGNSGSPIVHIKSGKVIAIAAYATVQRFDSVTGRPKDPPEVKRFGFRLDSVKQWQPVAWPEYSAEFQGLEKIDARTDELLKLLRTRLFDAASYTDPAIRGPLERYAIAGKNTGLIKTDPLSAARDLANSLHNACDTDIAQALVAIRYDHFRHRLGEQQKLRAESYKALEQWMKTLGK
jgi:hypothetical protein